MSDLARVPAALMLSLSLGCLPPPLEDCADNACGAVDTTGAADDGPPLAEVTGEPTTTTNPATGEATTTDDAVTSGDASTGPAVEDSAGGPPLWDSLTATPNQVMGRGPLTITAVVQHATEVDLRLDGAYLGTFAVPGDGKVEHQIPIVFEGQNGEHVVDAVARSPIGETPDSALFSALLPPGGQEQGEPWIDQEPAAHSVAFGLARAGDRVFTLGVVDEVTSPRLVLREHGDAGQLLGKRMLSDWTALDGLAAAEVSGFGMDVLVSEWDDLYVAANVVPEGETKASGYLAGLTLEGTRRFEVLLAPGEEIEGLAYHDGLIVAVGRKEVAGGRTVAAAWAFEAGNGQPFWEPVLVDVPEPDPNMLRSARFHEVTFTNDGNILAVGSTQVKKQGNDPTDPSRALFVRVSPSGELGESEIFTDQHFAAQTAALAVTPFTGPDGFCWTGWTRTLEEYLTPEMLVTYCQGETVVSRFSVWPNSAGLSIAYTPLTGRIHVGGYRSSQGAKGDAWVMSFANGSEPLESPHGWSWEYDGPAHGFDEVTALACQTYDCDVLAVDNLFGESRVRLGRLNQ